MSSIALNKSSSPMANDAGCDILSNVSPTTGSVMVMGSGRKSSFPRTWALWIARFDPRQTRVEVSQGAELTAVDMANIAGSSNRNRLGKLARFLDEVGAISRVQNVKFRHVMD